MKFNRVTRTLFPPITGYLIYLFCDALFEKVFPTKPVDDLSTPGIVFLLEFVGMLVWAAFIFMFQYKVIAPKTLDSTKRAIAVTVVVGLGVSLFFAFMDHTVGKQTIALASITFIRVFVQINSFFLGNLALIAVFNNMTDKPEVKEQSV